MVKNKAIEDIQLYGGRLCLDFINTIDDRVTEPENDYLSSIDDLIAWAFKLEVINLKIKKQLEKTASTNTHKAHEFYCQAITLRELLYRMFIGVIQGKRTFKIDLDIFNELLANYFSKLKLEQKGLRFEENLNLPTDSLYQITVPIFKDAYELMLTGMQKRIKECPKCGWLFYDISKNGMRRWCSMETCGSRTKALEWYHRQK